MFLYFYIIEPVFYLEKMAPAMAHSYRQRSFKPCLDLCRLLIARTSSLPQDALIRAVLNSLPYDRAFWHGLIGECLVHGALDIPRLQTEPDGFCCLLCPDHYNQADISRAQYAPIQQVHFGTRDLIFDKGFYRPEHAGIHFQKDVHRLTEYLKGIDPNRWTTRNLELNPCLQNDEQRQEELADLRDWWPGLVELYQTARDHNWIIVCERV